MRYQLGTGLIAGQTTMILAADEQLFHLGALLAGYADAPTSLLALFEGWERWSVELPRVVAERGIVRPLDPAAVTWLAPILYPRKLICLGANYKAHNVEMGFDDRPKFPYTFLKPPTTTLVGHRATVELPKLPKLIDWEAELAVVIGTRARDVAQADALQIVAGYSLFNDLSARDWVVDRSFLGMDWVMLKAYDGFGPFGPLITPASFIPDPDRLPIRSFVNDELMQDSNTADQVFSVPEIIAHLTAIMTLEPGDVIVTGTPPGVGFGRKPPRFLGSGDCVTIEIDGLGRLETTLR